MKNFKELKRSDKNHLNIRILLENKETVAFLFMLSFSSFFASLNKY